MENNSGEYLWGDNRRYHSFVLELKKQFGCRVQKIAVDAGFTCPNRNGTISTDGCSFCLNEAFNPSYCRKFNHNISKQLEEGIKFHKFRYRKVDKYLAYFQCYSNTYADINYLEKVYMEALSFPGIAGIVIATRPDCIDDEKIELLKYLSGKYYVSIEYGVESCYDDTLKQINRGHNFKTSQDAIIKTSKAGIKTGAHLIIGLPGDDKNRIINMAKCLSNLPINYLKLHQLQIFKNTPMEKQYIKDPSFFNLLNINEYIELIIDFVEVLNPYIAINRIAAETPPRYLANKGWGLIRNDEILRIFENRIEKRNTFQGKYFTNEF